MSSEVSPIDQLMEPWRTNHRINLYLIDRISPEGMRSTLSRHGGRDVVRQFAHMHTIRVARLKGWAKELTEGLPTFDTYDRPEKEILESALDASGAAVERFIEECASGVREKQGFKGGIGVSVGYLIAHESHHRGNILLTLKQCGHKVDSETRYAIWDWDRM